MASNHPELAAAAAEASLRDSSSGEYIGKDTSVRASVSIVSVDGNSEYWLRVASNTADRVWSRTQITENGDLDPYFNMEYLTFAFTDDSNSRKRWRLRFKTQREVMNFVHKGFIPALLGVQYHFSPENIGLDEVTAGIEDLSMEGTELEGSELSQRTRESSQEEHAENGDRGDEQDEVERAQNEFLTIGYSWLRSFVVERPQIDSYEEFPLQRPVYSTNISNIETLRTRSSNGNKVMFCNAKFLRHDDHPARLYRIEPESRDRSVRRWRVYEYKITDTFTLRKTFHRNFLGCSYNRFYKDEPASSRSDAPSFPVLKKSIHPNGFSALCKAESGYVAVAYKNDIRLFSGVSHIAKTHLPAIHPNLVSFSALDISDDGSWVVITCDTFLLLIDVRHTPGGELGFEKRFANGKKPKARQLALNETDLRRDGMNGVSLSPAKFARSSEREGTVVISTTGPYTIRWNLKKVLKGWRRPYGLQSTTYVSTAEDSTNDNLKNVVIALPLSFQ